MIQRTMLISIYPRVDHREINPPEACSLVACVNKNNNPNKRICVGGQRNGRSGQKCYVWSGAW